MKTELKVELLKENIKNFSESLFLQNKLDFNLVKALMEEEFIKVALTRNKGKINQTAMNASIAKNTLIKKIKKYSINVSEFKQKNG